MCEKEINLNVCEEHETEREARRLHRASLGALKLASEARDENMPTKWSDFFSIKLCKFKHFLLV